MDDGLVQWEGTFEETDGSKVLILIVVDDGLVLRIIDIHGNLIYVLILIVVDDGLVRQRLLWQTTDLSRLNPYCSGRWSRTAN